MSNLSLNLEEIYNGFCQYKIQKISEIPQKSPKRRLGLCFLKPKQPKKCTIESNNFSFIGENSKKSISLKITEKE